MLSRRSFLRSTAAGAGIATWSDQLQDLTSTFGSGTEVDWDEVRASFPITHWELLHLNSGSAGVMPMPVLTRLEELTRQMNAMAPYEAFALWQEERAQALTRLEDLVSAPPGSLRLVRNTTEGLNTIISQLKLQPQDEVIISKDIYPYARNAWKNKMTHSGAKLVEIDLNLPNSDDEVLDQMFAAMTPNTRVVHVSHMTHREGHIMPLRRIIEMSRAQDVLVVADGAHVVGQLPLDLTAIDPDFYVSSLHKWLNAPHGNGMLYVRDESFDTLHPFPSSYPTESNLPSQYDHLGTRAFQVELGIGPSLDFHELIGARTKYDRLQTLKHYWTSTLQEIERIKWHTDLTDAHSCAVVSFSIRRIKTGELLRQLREEYRIHAKMVITFQGSAIRISPNVFTSKQELDRLVQAIKSISMS